MYWRLASAQLKEIPLVLWKRSQAQAIMISCNVRVRLGGKTMLMALRGETGVCKTKLKEILLLFSSSLMASMRGRIRAGQERMWGRFSGPVWQNTHFLRSVMLCEN